MGSRPSQFKAEAVEAVPVRVWHSQQNDIFGWFQYPNHTQEQDGVFYAPTQHLIVNACAGTGKTTTLIEGVNRAPEKYVLICAFSKIIADELASRISRPGVEAKTMHSLGYFFIRREWRGLGVEAKRDARSMWLTDQVIEKKVPQGIRKLVSELHTMGRDLLPTDYSVKKLIELAIEYDLAPDEGWLSQGYTLDRIAEWAFAAMKHAAENPPSYETGIDFADMMFLPFAWALLEPMYDLVVVDEMQDFSKAQLLMALAVCRGRMAGFGDRRQAIFGFRGADTGSMDRIKAQLNALELPLTITYRCAQSIVRRAQRIVPIIEAAPGNPEGECIGYDYHDMIVSAAAGDFILSRLNAPLVRVTLKLLMMRKKARMRGREIGRGLVTLVRRLTSGRTWMPMEDFRTALDRWETKQVAYLLARNDKEGAAREQDRAAMLAAFAQDSSTTMQLVQDIEALFVDTTDDDTIICSSIHKAKGLEAHTVYILQETLYLRGVDEDEQNCDYVATTRAKERLRLVTGMPGGRR